LTSHAEPAPAKSSPLAWGSDRRGMPAWKRWFYGLLALVMTGAFLGLNWAIWVPVHPGVDQNGYLVGGRMLAETGSPCLRGTHPDTGQLDPFQFVGRMWVGVDLGKPTERFYPKYPIGLPMLVAGCMKLGGMTYGPMATYWISPVGMTLAIAATYLLIRELAGSFAGFLGAAVLACSPVTLGLTTNPNSHGSTLFFVTWGMYLAMRWWQHGGVLRAVLAGLLLGSAVTIRYTEGLLLLPLFLVAVFRVASVIYRRRHAAGAPSPSVLGAVFQSMLALAAWALPVAGLVLFNWKAMGTLTGYDPTNESKGFAWEYFGTNWYSMLHQLNDTGMSFIFPLSLAALVCMFWWNWRVAMVMAAWIIPNALIYGFYYWAPDRAADPFINTAHISYLRFFLTVLPALAACAYWLLSRIYAMAIDPDRLQSPQTVSMIVAGVLTAASIGLSLRYASGYVSNDHHGRLMLKARADETMSALRSAGATDGDLVFCGDENIAHHLQFISRYRFYNTGLFSGRAVGDLLKMDPEEPQGLDPNRRLALSRYFDRMVEQHLGTPVSDLSSYQRSSELNSLLRQRQQQIIHKALVEGRRVFFLAGGRNPDRSIFRGDSDVYELRTVSSWSYGMPPPERRPSTTGGKRAAPAWRDAGRKDFSQVIQVTLRPPATEPAVITTRPSETPPRPTTKPRRMRPRPLN